MICIPGIENPALDTQPSLAIAVPFTPTIGCRIDFNNVPLDALTPCSMLNNKLIFSPVKKPADLTPKRPNLSIISEEAVDISKELESYQLELENSMNEAKATKKRGNKNLMDMRRKSTFARRLLDAVTVDADVSIQSTRQTEQITDIVDDEQPANKPDDEHSCQEKSDGHSECPKSSTPKTPNENCIAKYSLDRSIGENPDFVYEEIDEISHRFKMHDAGSQNSQEDIENIASNRVNVADVSVECSTIAASIALKNEAPISVERIEFKNPAPFVRTYRRDVSKPITKAPTMTEENATAQPAIGNEKPKGHHEVFGSIRSSIRKSIRKLIQPSGGANDTGGRSKSIRGSLRACDGRKQPLATSTPCESLNDISIIDNCKPRAIFKDTATTVAEKVIAMDSAGDKDVLGSGNGGGILKGLTTIRSSFRKSSRHVMKSVFKKNIEDYDLEK